MIKNIPLYEKLYGIDKNGNVYSYPKDRRNRIKENNKTIMLKHFLDNRGYKCVALSCNGKRKQFYIHKLLGICFLNNPFNKKQVNHIDGNKLNNSLCNLEWVTNSENQQHAHNLGLYDRKGVKNSQHKINEDIVRTIRELKGKYTYLKIAGMFNVSEALVSHVLTGRSWAHVV